MTLNSYWLYQIFLPYLLNPLIKNSTQLLFLEWGLDTNSTDGV